MAHIDIIGAEWFGDPKKAPANNKYSWLPDVVGGVGGIISQFFGSKQKVPAPITGPAPIPWLPIMVGGGGIILLVTIIATKKRK